MLRPSPPAFGHLEWLFFRRDLGMKEASSKVPVLLIDRGNWLYISKPLDSHKWCSTDFLPRVTSEKKKTRSVSLWCMCCDCVWSWSYFIVILLFSVCIKELILVIARMFVQYPFSFSASCLFSPALKSYFCLNALESWVEAPGPIAIFFSPSVFSHFFFCFLFLWIRGNSKSNNLSPIPPPHTHTPIPHPSTPTTASQKKISDAVFFLFFIWGLQTRPIQILLSLYFLVIVVVLQDGLHIDHILI